MDLNIIVKPIIYKCPFYKKTVVILPVRIVELDKGYMIVWRCNNVNCLSTDCRYSRPSTSKQ